MEKIFREHRFPQSLRRDKNRVLALGHEVERQDAFDRGPMDLFRPVPVPVRHRPEAAEAGVFQPAFHPAAGAGLEFGLGYRFE